MMKQMPTTEKLKKEWIIHPQISGTELTEDEEIIVNNIQELLGPEKNISIEHKSTLDQNISNIYRLVWGQLTPALKEYITGLYNYWLKSNKYD